MNYYPEQANRSDYVYKVHNGVIAIKDLNLGKMSVTNNIENVVTKICQDEDLDIRWHTIIYQDSEGEIYEFYLSDKSFHPISFNFKQKCLKLIPQ